MYLEETFLVLLPKKTNSALSYSYIKICSCWSTVNSDDNTHSCWETVNNDNKIYNCWSTVDGVHNIHNCWNTDNDGDKIHSCCYAVNSGDKYTDTVNGDVRIHNCWNTLIVMIRFHGLRVACWRLVPKFAGSNQAEAVGYLGRKNPQHAFLWRGSKAVGPVS